MTGSFIARPTRYEPIIPLPPHSHVPQAEPRPPDTNHRRHQPRTSEESSPRFEATSRRPTGGTIPTQAGNSRGVSSSMRCCAELSPHVQGAATTSGELTRIVRAIPARAGSRGRSPRPGRSGRDHPHTGGEQSLSCCAAVSQGGGPSPRRQGPGHHAPLPGRMERTIPTRAGSSGPSPKPTWPPREPSPRARGADVLGGAGGVRLCGTIPTQTGNGPTRIPRYTQTRDHPRRRGEQPSKANGSLAAWGPSPRARGAAGCRSARGALGHPRGGREQFE